MEVLDMQQDQMEQGFAREITILCSLCGCSFAPSATGTSVCLKCISTTTDITNGITKQAVLNFCRTCKRYLRPPWVHAELESKDLLALCLRKIRGLNKLKLLDASFIWTEPHSRRVKVKLTVQKEVLNNINVQQTFVIEFSIFYQQCEDCKKEYTPHTWGAAVQVRQKVDHKKTFFFLEQLILKYNAHEKVLKIKDLPEGVDFFYKNKTHAQRLVDFLQNMFSIRVKHSKQLISQDLKSNTCNYKYVYSIDLPKVCKDDLVVVPPKIASQLGGCSNILICTKVATMVTFMDPINMKIIEISGTQYFQYENELSFIPAKGNITEFMVFDIEACEAPKNGNETNNKVKVARAEIARASDWKQFEVKTYLGDVLKQGSSVLGYDMTALSLSGLMDDDSSLLKKLPDVILLKKNYQLAKNLKRRIWRLKELEKEAADTKAMHKDETKKAKDYEEFLNDLETDPEMRSHVNLYRNEKAIRDKENKMVDENEEGNEKNEGKKKKQLKKKLKVKKGKKGGQAGAAAGAGAGKDQENQDDKKDEEKEDKKEGDEKKIEENEEEEDEDELVKIGELLEDMTLEDHVEPEANDDEIDEFIKKLEKVKIEGKE